VKVTHRALIVLLGAVLGTGGGRAAAQELRRITLDEALILFQRDNLGLRLARAVAAEAAAVARQVAAYPNPTLTATRESLASGSYTESYVNLSQRLEWPPTRAARRESADALAAAERARLEADSAALAFEVKAAYVAAAGAELVELALSRVATVFREGERRAQDRLDEGDISLYDVKRIRLERVRYESFLADAQLDAADARRTLTLLVAPAAEGAELAPADAISGVPPAVTPDMSPETALVNRREIAAAEARLESAVAATSTTGRERIPEVTATGGYKTQSDGSSGAFLGASLPLPLWDRRAGAIDAAGTRVSAAESMLALTRLRVENDVLRAVSAHRSLARRAEMLSEGMSADAGELLDVALVAYEEGEMELMELLDAADAFREARLAEVRLRRDLWTSYYDLERAVGGYDAPAGEAGDER
jgi:cobalt-zinc-cadmium efflux system outer membrane protein